MFLYQGSGDLFLSTNFIASTAALTYIVADLIVNQVRLLTIGDARIYKDHINQVQEQLKREPKISQIIQSGEHSTLESYKYEDFTNRISITSRN